MDIDHDVPTILATLRMEADPELAPQFYTMEDLWERKLWHQLTSALAEFFRDPLSIPLRIRVYSQFISFFQNKINQLKLVTFGLSAATQYNDANEALEFLSVLSDKVNTPSTQDAYVFSQIEIARVKLSLKDFDGARSVLDSASSILDKFDSTESIINAAFYGVNSDYYMAKGEFSAYYRHALLYLACADLSLLSIVEIQKIAYNLCIAALLGDEIYNFGELLLHPVLDSLKDTEYSWLRDLLLAINAGDIPSFENLVQNLSKQPILENAAPFLKQKICLTALIEAVFKRPSTDRTLTFETIAKETYIVNDEVEHLVMKALSLGLIRGLIDEVSQTVAITWLQPRVMNKLQIGNMREKLLQWDQEVEKLG
ncbi:PCI-domain-containing protein, partial [Nadsonia fulvescens var. elongata DSM 6958]